MRFASAFIRDGGLFAACGHSHPDREDARFCAVDRHDASFGRVGGAIDPDDDPTVVTIPGRGRPRTQP